MSDNTGFKSIAESNEWVKWINEAVAAKDYIKSYERKHFSDIQEIDSGSYGKVYRASWKNSQGYLALKSFYDLNNTIAKEIIHEFKLQHQVNFHNNIIRFCGIIISYEEENQVDNSKYLLVIEYADSGTLRSYLKQHFENLTWTDKFELALQLSSAVLCLHDQGIAHRDLHSNNVLIHQSVIKLTDFGLSKRIEESSNIQPKLHEKVTYIDPKIFNQVQIYSLNKKSDIYSIGILFWEISSGRPPFCNEPCDDNNLAIRILHGLREAPISDTPEDYIKLYTDCWNSEPDNRPTINQVADKLKAISTKNNNCNINADVQLLVIQNFGKINIEEMEPTTYIVPVNIIVDEIINILNKLEEVEEKQEILNYLNNYNITSQEIYYWLLNNQDNSNSVLLLGVFYYLGIWIDVNKQKAFELYQKAANLSNSIAQYNLAFMYDKGDYVNQDREKAFELFKKSSEGEYPESICMLGYYYQYGIETDLDSKKAFELYQKAANLGNIIAKYNLAFMYKNGENYWTS
ncbi:kinase-like domain-containing protein [Rhizophagus irregularis DAOM 181602=DAOM 197198]|nr:kinase-like domain-containing protein [Rhizophagus irregularis DAOM 181602=DAOM 197198]